MTENQSKLRVLFVDDEAEILNGLRLTLRKERKRFDMLFAHGGVEAIVMMKQHEVDVVCTDLLMPDLDGSQLLEHLVEYYPSVGRVVLSGHADDAVALRAISLAHRFLVKPTARDLIVNALTELHSTLGTIERFDLREATGGTACLPSDPSLCTQLIRQLADESFDTEPAASTIGQEPAIAAKLLQLANSSYISQDPKITSIPEAARMVGKSTLQAIAPHLECACESSSPSVPDSSKRSSIRVRSILTAQVAQRIAQDNALDGELAFTAGLLSGIGHLLLEAKAPLVAHHTESNAVTEDRPLFEAQQLEIGVDHSQLAAALLGSWGLPHSVTDLICAIHKPKSTNSGEFDLSGAIHIAYYLAHKSLNQLAANQAYAPQHLDLSYVHATGTSADIQEWNDFTRDLAEQMLTEIDYKAA